MRIFLASFLFGCALVLAAEAALAPSSGEFRYGLKVLDVVASPKENERESKVLEESGQENDAAEHPYLEDSLKQLVKRIPELKAIRPAAEQQALAMILQKTGARTDEFFANMVDLIAHEEIKQKRLGTFGVAGGSESVHDNYLVLRRGNGRELDFEEFRMDEKGDRRTGVSHSRGSDRRDLRDAHGILFQSDAGSGIRLTSSQDSGNSRGKLYQMESALNTYSGWSNDARNCCRAARYLTGSMRDDSSWHSPSIHRKRLGEGAAL